MNTTENKQRCVVFTASSPIRQLATSAIIQSLDRDSLPAQCRTLLDTCSSADFVTERLADLLRLPKKRCFIPIGALNDLVAKAVVKIAIRSIHTDYKTTFSFLIIPRIANLIPKEIIPREILHIPPNVLLADPHFHEPAPIDMLLGSRPSLSTFCAGQIDLSNKNWDIILQ